MGVSAKVSKKQKIFSELNKKATHFLLDDDPKVIITSVTKDLSLILGQNKTVTFRVENSSLLEVSVTINFVQNPHNKVKLVPPSVTIEGKDFEEFDIDICATDAGRTTVTSNSSSPDLK